MGHSEASVTLSSREAASELGGASLSAPRLWSARPTWEGSLKCFPVWGRKPVSRPHDPGNESGPEGLSHEDQKSFQVRSPDSDIPAHQHAEAHTSTQPQNFLWSENKNVRCFSKTVISAPEPGGWCAKRNRPGTEKFGILCVTRFWANAREVTLQKSSHVIH